MSKSTSDQHIAKPSSHGVSPDAEQAKSQHFDDVPSTDISSLIHDINNCVMLISILSESYESKANLSTGADDATQAITVNEPVVILRDNVSQLIDMLGELYQVLPQRKAKPKNLEVYNNAKFLAFLESKSKEWQLLLTPNASISVINNGFDGCVFIDELALSRCLHNLVRNSSEAHLSAPQNSYDLCVSVILCQDNNNVLLIVEDNGVSIPSQIENHLFERDFSSKKKKSSHAQVGHGLASAKECVEGIGGKIIYDKAFNAGVRFIITLPVMSVD